MLIWGPIQFLLIVRFPYPCKRLTHLTLYALQIAREVFDTFDRLNEIGERLEHCLDRFKYHTSGDSASGPLRGLLLKFYIHIIQFSITASQVYRRPSLSMCLAAEI
jgi:hypothetical protein